LFACALVIFLFLGSLVTTSVEAEEPEQKVKWSVFIYMAADNNLEEAAILDMNELEQVGSTEDVNIVVQLDRASGHDSSNGDWKDTRRYLITKDDDKNNTTSTRLDTDDPLGELSMNDPAVLVDFLSWAVENYPAEHYVVDLWDHGLGTNGGTLNDGTYMPLTGLEEAFEELKNKGLYFDIITFDACLMGGIENYYNTIDIAAIAVSSEKLVPFYGYPYHLILDKLVENPEMNASILAEKFVKHYVWYYQHSIAISVTQSAINNTALASFTKTFNQWTEMLMAYFPLYEDEIRAARNETEEYDHSERLYNYVDLYHFIENVNDSIDTEEFNMMSSSLLTSFEETVIVESHWSNFNKHDGKDSAENAHGFTIYFPDKSKDSYYNSYADIRFVRETNWKDFLDMFFLFKDDDYRDNHKPCVEFEHENLTTGTDEQGYNNSFTFTYSLRLKNEKSEKKVHLRYQLYDRYNTLTLNATTPFFNFINATSHPVHYTVPENDFSFYKLFIYLYDEDGVFLDHYVAEIPLEYVDVSLDSETQETHIEPGDSFLFTLTVTNTGNSRKTFVLGSKMMPLGWHLSFDNAELVLEAGQSEGILGNLSIPESMKASDMPSTIIISAKCKSNESVYSILYLEVYVGGEEDEDDWVVLGVELSRFQVIGLGVAILLIIVGILFMAKRKRRQALARSGIVRSGLPGMPKAMPPSQDFPGQNDPFLMKESLSRVPSLRNESFRPSSFAPEPEGETASEPGIAEEMPPAVRGLGHEHIATEKEPTSSGYNLGGEEIGPKEDKEEKKSLGFNLGGEKIEGPEPSPEPTRSSFNLGGEKIEGADSSPEVPESSFNLGGEKVGGAAPSPEGPQASFNLGGEEIEGAEGKEKSEPSSFNLGDEKIEGTEPSPEPPESSFNLGGEQIEGAEGKEESEPSSFNLGGEKIEGVEGKEKSEPSSFNLGGEKIEGVEGKEKSERPSKEE